VQLAGNRPDQLAQAILDVEVNVLERSRESERAGLDLGGDRVQSARDCLGVLLGQDAGRAEHGDMRLGSQNIVMPEPLVEADGGVYLLHDGGGARGETATPHGVGHELRA